MPVSCVAMAVVAAHQPPVSSKVSEELTGAQLARALRVVDRAFAELGRSPFFDVDEETAATLVRDPASLLGPNYYHFFRLFPGEKAPASAWWCYSKGKYDVGIEPSLWRDFFQEKLIDEGRELRHSGGSEGRGSFPVWLVPDDVRKFDNDIAYRRWLRDELVEERRQRTIKNAAKKQAAAMKRSAAVAFAPPEVVEGGPSTPDSSSSSSAGPSDDGAAASPIALEFPSCCAAAAVPAAPPPESSASPADTPEPSGLDYPPEVYDFLSVLVTEMAEEMAASASAPAPAPAPAEPDPIIRGDPFAIPLISRDDPTLAETMATIDFL